MDRVRTYSIALGVIAYLIFASAAVFADHKNQAAPSHAAQAPSHPAPSASHGGGQPGGGAPHGMPQGNRGANAVGNGPHGSGPGNGTNRAGSQNGAAGNGRNMQGGQNARGMAAGNNRGNQAGSQAGTGNRNGNQMGNRNGNQVGKGANQGGMQGGNRAGNQMNNRRQPAGSRTVSLKSGGQATFRKDGKVRSIQTHNMRIDHGVRGQRRVVAEHNGRRVVAVGRHGGYSQRAYYRHGNRVYVQRTYVVGGRTYAYAYRTYYYGGYPYYGYAPAYYYSPVYYGWAYNPWPAPVYYNWGWAGQPWYGYYGPYYQPYPSYPYASRWLTDYIMSENLRQAYAAAAAEQGELTPPQLKPESSGDVASLWASDPLVEASIPAAYGSGIYLFGAPAPSSKTNGTQLSPEVKQAIADQVQKEIASEKDAAASKDKDSGSGGDQVPAALDPNTRYFVVSSNLDLTTSNGDECELTAGDVIYRTGDTPDDDKMVDAVVKASKKDECAIGSTVGVEVSDLQDMHNSLRQTMDAGLKQLADNSGKNGLPAAPDTKTTAGEVPPPTPDANVSDDLQQTQKEADQAESEAQQPN